MLITQLAAPRRRFSLPTPVARLVLGLALVSRSRRANVRRVQQPHFSVPVRDLERSDQHRSWEVPAAWLDSALADSDARSDGSAGRLELYLKKSAGEVLVKGSVKANVVMPCARTLEPVNVALDAPILLLLERRAPAPGARPERNPRPDSAAPRKGKPDPAEAELSAEDAARDYYEGETVVLDDFVREHLLLELPLFPVRSDLPLDQPGATDSLPQAEDTPDEERIDPRLAPLAALRSSMAKDK
jgi:uncharacterized protein